MAVKKYLFVTHALSFGGAERVVSVLASGMAERGYEVHLILYEKVNGEYPISDKVNIHLLPKIAGKHGIKYFAKMLAAMRRKIAEVAPDVIIPFLPNQVIHFFIASRLMNIPFVATVRNNPFLYPDSKPKRTIGKIVALLSSGIFLQTEEQAGFFPRFAKRKTFVIPNPVSSDLIDRNYRNRDHIREIATFGRLSTQKNQHLLIEAFAIVHKTNPSLRLSLYGAGEEEQNLKALVAKLGVKDAVTFRGSVSNVGEALLSTDLFVLSSNYEGMPNALMEAMAVGLPCISTDCPTGPKDLIDHMNDGILVKSNNVSELVSAIHYCVANPVFCHQAGSAAKKKIRDAYQVDVIIDKFIHEINGVKGCS
ncbi:glycosyltransferase [Paenibacillus silvisoli]|uniref:glycosyltransferase n=1 Tax=Paenibacillus silvisoli TaxID=3110539 RepID=UPI0028060512|nr:glycosyltransferase [Paenibacillus silvisoli]